MKSCKAKKIVERLVGVTAAKSILREARVSGRLHILSPEEHQKALDNDPIIRRGKLNRTGGEHHAEDGEFEGLKWWDGNWYGGTWAGDRWQDGTWHDGTWKSGSFEGTWKNGTWLDGFFNAI